MKTEEEIWYDKLYDVSDIKSPFEILTAHQITTLVAKKWAEYHVHPIKGKTIQDVFKSNPRTKVKAWKDDDSGEAKKWVIFNSENDDTKQAYRKIIEYEKDLSILSQKQIELNNATIYVNVDQMRSEIEELFKKLFPVDNNQKKDNNLTNVRQPNKRQSKKEITKSRTLFDIWKDDKEKFHTVIALLKNDYREIHNPFIKDEGGVIVWCKYPARGWQMYLAAFLYVCDQKNYIPITIYSDIELMEICKNTFSIDKLSPDNFSKMRGGSLDNKYTTPFTEIMSRL